MSRKKEEINEVPPFCDALLKRAVDLGASDIYLLPGAQETAFRCRVNGIQHDLDRVPEAFGVQCTARFKVMAGMLSYRSQIAQDGAIRHVPGLGDVEFRVASMPTIHGERLTIRLFDRRFGRESLDELGFQDEMTATLRTILKRPTGLVILTGPTGCGKTTTIYAMLRELLIREEDPSSIITIEDPVECEIDGISQISLPRGDAEWNYAAALRSALRHDVKTLMIGEMRDREVVKVALDAALTGHRIITTYHAGDIPSVFARLLHQGFEPFLVGAAVSGVAAQRLVHTAGGSGRIPVVAALAVTDQWRDFLAEAPSPAAIRDRISDTPGADLESVVRSLAEAGAIPEKEIYLL